MGRFLTKEKHVFNKWRNALNVKDMNVTVDSGKTATPSIWDCDSCKMNQLKESMQDLYNGQLFCS